MFILQKETTAMAISKKPFGVTPDGHDVTQFTLTNARGASVRVIN